MSPLRLTKNDVLRIHEYAIARFGGLGGARDEGLLESALAQPHLTFDGVDLYPSAEDKAAYYAYGICKDHPFVDGNKRVAAACLGAYLRLEGLDFAPERAEFLKVMFGVADGTVDYDALLDWVRKVTGNAALL